MHMKTKRRRNIIFHYCIKMIDKEIRAWDRAHNLSDHPLFLPGDTDI